MKSTLRGHLKNVVLSKANGLLPLFEAVVNSIQAIEDRYKTSADVTIVEIKRPMLGGHRDGEDSDPIAQAYGYLRRIRNGGVLSNTDRHILKAHSLPAHVYVIADLTKSMRQLCEDKGLRDTPNGLSFFGYNPNPSLQAYTEVIDFQGLLSHATERNSAFFQQLSLPSSR
ncbi:hypothetical protein [Litoreibacter albidus]|uniref:hypothetical protein n=1 Tax=Litoreibacter albidus TaxID=670155 RepID=UPI0037370683